MKSSSYIAYMLRMWRVTDHSKEIWRASLENPKTGIRHNFSTIDDLIEYLNQEMHMHDSEKEDEE